MANYRDLALFQRGFQDFGQGIGSAVSSYIQKRQEDEKRARALQAIRSYAGQLNQKGQELSQKFGSPAPALEDPQTLMDVYGADIGGIYRHMKDFETKHLTPEQQVMTSPEGEMSNVTRFNGKVAIEPVMGPGNQPIKKPQTSEQKAVDYLMRTNPGMDEGQAIIEYQKMINAARAQGTAAVAEPRDIERERRAQERKTQDRIREIDGEIARIDNLSTSLWPQIKDMEKNVYVKTADGRTVENKRYAGYGHWRTLKTHMIEEEARRKALKAEREQLTKPGK